MLFVVRTLYWSFYYLFWIRANFLQSLLQDIVSSGQNSPKLSYIVSYIFFLCPLLYLNNRFMLTLSFLWLFLFHTLWKSGQIHGLEYWSEYWPEKMVWKDAGMNGQQVKTLSFRARYKTLHFWISCKDIRKDFPSKSFDVFTNNL